VTLIARLADAAGHARPLRRIPLGVLFAAAGALGAYAVAGTGSAPVADRIWAGAFAAFVSFSAAYSRRWPWVLLSGIAAASAGGWAQVAALVLLAWAFLAAQASRRSRRVGALIGAGSAAVLLAGRELPPLTHLALGTVAVAATAWSAYRGAHRVDRAVARRWVLGFTGLVVLAAGAYGAGAFAARADALDGVDHLRDGIDAAERGDTTVATAELRVAARKLRAADRALDRPWTVPARYVPFLGQNARAANQLVRSGADLAGVASAAADEVDLDRVELRRGRIDLGIARQVADATGTVSLALDDALVDLRNVRSDFVAGPLQARLDEATDLLLDARPAVTNVRDAAAAAPVVLGSDTPKRYLVLFTTPVEARGLIGFPGNYAELEASDGAIVMTQFGRVGRDLQTLGLPLTARTITGPPDYLARYTRFAPAQTWHNITMSPDLPSVAKVAAELYPQSGGRPVDGVMVVNPTGIAALLKLTGPVSVPGVSTPISAANAVDFLQVRQYVELQLGDRIDALEAVGRATFDKLTNGDLPEVRTIADALSPAVRARGLLFYSFDDEVVPVLRRAGVDGAFPPVEGDIVAVLTHNASANKMDAYTERETTYDVLWDAETGDVQATLTTVFTNRGPATGLSWYVAGLGLKPFPGQPSGVPPGTNRSIVSVYTPWRPDTAKLDGRPLDLQVERELDRYVGSTVVDIAPGRSVTLSVSWTGRLTPAGVYRFDLVHQPQARAERVKVRVRNATGGPLTMQTPTGVASGSEATAELETTGDFRFAVTASR
jgi:hypothetical protein